MILEKILINNKDELLRNKEKIFQLFQKCFGKPIDEDLWSWAYIENPNGEPIISLCFDEKKLVGHYAVIPIKLKDRKNKIFKAVLSMTTMVDRAYRRHGVFVKQANEVYEEAQSKGYKVVIGFPNANSAPGFKKRLNWILEEDLFVAKLSKNDLMQIKTNYSQNVLMFNISDEKNLKWRLNKPNHEYININNNLIYKKYGDEIDIVYSDGDFQNLDEDLKIKYNILINNNTNQFINKKSFNYVFGYKFFDDSLLDRDLKKDLIISDIF